MAKAGDEAFLSRTTHAASKPSLKQWAKGGSKAQVLVVEHADGRREHTEHPSKAAAQRAAAAHLDANGGKGKLAIAPKGKEHTVTPLPAQGGTRPAGPIAAKPEHAEREHAVRKTYTGAYGEPAKSPSGRDVAAHQQSASNATSHANANGKPAAHEQAAHLHRTAAVVTRDAAQAFRAAGHEKIAAMHERDSKGHEASAKAHDKAASEAKGSAKGGGFDEYNRDESGKFASK